MSTRNYFSPNYTVARDRFREGAISAGGRLQSLPLQALGPAGEELTIDIAWFGAEHPRRVYVHSSGVHGVELFAGSAIQLQWLTENATEAPPADSAMVLIHAVNPYGAAWLRRFNENNVDLNRNFRAAGDFAPEVLPFWEKVNPLLNPGTPPQADGFYLRAAWLVFRYGMASVRQAVACGQTLNPDGLFFTGVRPEESVTLLEQFVRERFAGAEAIVGMDVHTGLGAFGDDRLLVDSADARAEANRVMLAVYGNHVEVMSKEGVAYKVRGPQHDMYFRLFPQAQVYFTSQEFGTYPGLRVVSALREETRLHLYGGNRRSDRNEAAKRNLLEMFNPARDVWQKAILARGRQVMKQMLALGLKSNLN